MVNPAKTIALPPKGYAPRAEEISLLESVDVCIESKGGTTVVGVPIGTDEYVRDRAIEVVRDGGADRLTRCFASMPDKQAAVLVAIESLGQRTSCLERFWTLGCPSKRAEGQTTGRSGLMKTSWSYPERRRHSLLSRKGAPVIS